MQLEVIKEDSLSAIREQTALCDKSSIVMEKHAELQETEITPYEDTHKKTFFNRVRIESAGLGIKS